jgi:hypothetical protein
MMTFPEAVCFENGAGEALFFAGGGPLVLACEGAYAAFGFPVFGVVATEGAANVAGALLATL